MQLIPNKPSSGEKGFSLPELLLVIFLCCLIFGLILPSTFLSSHTVNAQMLSQQLIRAIQLARSTAIANGSTITLCASSGLKLCEKDWAGGQLIVNDAGEKIFGFAGDHNGYLQWRSALGKTYLQFLSDGTSAFQHGTFTYYMQDKDHPLWQIIVNSQGRARLLSLH